MKAFLSCKIVLAEPEQKNGQDGYRVVYPDGYISWSPKEPFDLSHREIILKEEVLLQEYWRRQNAPK